MFVFINFISVKERVEALEDILISSGQVQTESGKNFQQHKQQQQFSVSSVKRDSMVAGLK